MELGWGVSRGRTKTKRAHKNQEGECVRGGL